MNVEEVFFSIARDIKQRLAETDSKSEVQIVINHASINIANLFFIRHWSFYYTNAASDHKDFTTRPGRWGRSSCSEISLLWLSEMTWLLGWLVIPYLHHFENYDSISVPCICYSSILLMLILFVSHSGNEVEIPISAKTSQVRLRSPLLSLPFETPKKLYLPLSGSLGVWCHRVARDSKKLGSFSKLMSYEWKGDFA